MDVALPLIAGLGGALVGSVAGFFGALHLESRKEAQRRRGILTALHTDLSDNAVKARVMLQKLEDEGREGPLWDSSGPVSADFWRATIVEMGSFLPFDLFFKLRVAYEELPFFKTFGDSPGQAPRQEEAVQLLEHWLKLIEGLQDEIIHLPEALAIRESVPQAFRFIRDRAEWKKRLAQGSTRTKEG